MPFNSLGYFSLAASTLGFFKTVMISDDIIDLLIAAQPVSPSS